MTLKVIGGDAKSQDLNDNFSYLNQETVTKASVAYVNSQIQNIGSGTPKGVYPTLPHLYVAYPNGTTGIYIIQADGHWYYWNGTVWADGGAYQSAVISNHSIEPLKTTFFEMEGSNLYNPDDVNVVRGGYYNNAGTLVNSPTLGQSGYVPVKGLEKYTATYKGAFVLWFSENLTFISETSSTEFNTNGYVTAPAGASYGRFIFTLSGESVYKIEQGNVLTPYEPYLGYKLMSEKLPVISEDKIPILSEGKIPYGLPLAKMDFGTNGKNLYDPLDPDKVSGGYFNTSNILVTAATYNQTGYIPVEPSLKYTATYKAAFVLWFDDDKILIGETSSTEFNTNGYVTAPAGASYGRFIFVDSFAPTYQVEVGTTPSSYEPFFRYIKPEVMPPQIFSNVLDGKKWTSYGDSITFRELWQPFVYNYFDLVHTNLGIGSTTLAYVAAWEETYPSFVNADRMNDLMASNPDIVTILGGANDQARSVPIGDDSQFTLPIGSKDKATFKGAYSFIIETLLTWKPTLEIILLSTMASGYTTGNKNYADATIEVAKFYSLPCIDLYYESGISRYNINTYTSDQVHPNAAGARRIANMMISQLKNLYNI